MLPSLAKYRHETETPDGLPLHWGRVAEDGLPFVGNPSLLTNEEAEVRLVQCLTARNRRFNLLDAEDNKAYLNVIEHCGNGHYIRLKDVTLVATLDQHVVYVEWLERYMQDGGPRGGASTVVTSPY